MNSKKRKETVPGAQTAKEKEKSGFNWRFWHKNKTPKKEKEPKSTKAAESKAMRELKVQDGDVCSGDLFLLHPISEEACVGETKQGEDTHFE